MISTHLLALVFKNQNDQYRYLKIGSRIGNKQIAASRTYDWLDFITVRKGSLDQDNGLRQSSEITTCKKRGGPHFFLKLPIFCKSETDVKRKRKKRLKTNLTKGEMD